MLNPTSQLDRDLGLGSLERVELLARLETAFNIRLPDSVASEANTPDDLTRAILTAPGTNVEDVEEDSALRASVTVQKLHRAARMRESSPPRPSSMCCVSRGARRPARALVDHRRW